MHRSASATKMTLGAAVALLPRPAVTAEVRKAADAMAWPEGVAGTSYTPPRVDPSEVQPQESEITGPPKQFTAEELAIYSRTYELFNELNRDPKIYFPVEFGMFRHWLNVEMLAAQFESRSVDIQKCRDGF